MKILKSSIRLHASSKAVIALFLHLPGRNRVMNIVKRVVSWNEEKVSELMHILLSDFSTRHHHIENILLAHSSNIEKQMPDVVSGFSLNRKLVLGSLFTKEYAIQAAALFNPSIVPHPDQQNLNAGEVRFIISLRATGEGHISSVVFQTGVIDQSAGILLDPQPTRFTALQRDAEAIYTRDFIAKGLSASTKFDAGILDLLPAQFTADEVYRILDNLTADSALFSKEVSQIKEVVDSNYELKAVSDLPLNETVVFPVAACECMGMEDVRLVRFEDKAGSCYYGTYTAYDGHRIKTQLITTHDFCSFSIRSLNGAAIDDKGMALFPEKINGRYAMISRQGGEVINIMYSDDLYRWDSWQLLMEPHFEWEAVQIGNCGSPVKTEEGWLLLTHGVGVMRTYVISAVLLDLTDPSRIIGRLKQPLLFAAQSDREGYVPNVVYTCGYLLHEGMLIIPYALADAATVFASIDLKELLNEMKIK